MSSQYAFVGTSASPTHAKLRTNMHARKIGRLPQWSANVPQNMGAMERKQIINLTHACIIRYSQTPCRTMYMVTVRLINSVDFPNTLDSSGIAGK